MDDKTLEKSTKGSVTKANKDRRAKEKELEKEKIQNKSRSTEINTITQSRLSTSSLETRVYNVQNVTSTNQIAQAGNNKPNSQVSGISESKVHNTLRLGNTNTSENKNQSFHNRNSQIVKNQTEYKKKQLIHPRPQTQSLKNEYKVHSNQSRLSVSSPSLEGKTLNNQGQLSQNSNTSVLDKTPRGQRNQLQTSQVKVRNSQSNVTPMRQTEVRTGSSSKVQQSVKLISTISQFHPPVSRPSNALNNGKVVVDKTFVAASERSINNPFPVASTLTKSSPEEKYVLKVTKIAQNVDVSDNQSIQAKIPQQISMKTENKGVSKVRKIPEVTSYLHQKNLPFDSSSDLNSQRLTNMPVQKTAVKRTTVTSSPPNSSSKKKCIRVMSPAVPDQSGNVSDINSLSSDESPIKEKKVFNLKTLTPGLAITPIHSSATNPSTSDEASKIAAAKKILMGVSDAFEEDPGVMFNRSYIKKEKSNIFSTKSKGVKIAEKTVEKNEDRSIRFLKPGDIKNNTVKQKDKTGYNYFVWEEKFLKPKWKKN